MSSVLPEEVEVSAVNANNLGVARELATVARELCDALVRVSPGPESERLLAQLQPITQEMKALADPGVVPWFYGDVRPKRWEANQAGKQPQEQHELSDYNPIMPPLRMTVDGDESHGVVRLGPAFTGPPGHVHGGVLATIVDHAMGLLVSVAAQPSVTARLEMNYVGGAPIGGELQVTASIEERAGRKTWVTAEISVAGNVCVRARGLFVAPGATRTSPDA